MRVKIFKLAKRVSVLLVIAVITLLALRVYDVQRGPPLALWHTFVPHELRAKELDAADWGQYLAEEAKLFESLQKEVTQKLDPDDRVPANRLTPKSSRWRSSPRCRGITAMRRSGAMSTRTGGISPRPSRADPCSPGTAPICRCSSRWF